VLGLLDQVENMRCWVERAWLGNNRDFMGSWYARKLSATFSSAAACGNASCLLATRAYSTGSLLHVKQIDGDRSGAMNETTIEGSDDSLSSSKRATKPTFMPKSRRDWALR
jgi:hypothetical protein